MNKKILKLIEHRLLVGERKYGHQHIVNDGRDFLKEALESVGLKPGATPKEVQEYLGNSNKSLLAQQ